ncbi:hypothetical protein DFP72DRAFT_886722 [Ephemerocybe angulata]|uniref:Uncharacterized protein n=1 Tax=Ephemerocybe angulata TaxID=980116 RepID=A0A8H6I4N1_9AGAR|nr:hypothetical protein DFP72DRAFT_886722 [Tulosesus angulatus]
MKNLSIIAILSLSAVGTLAAPIPEAANGSVAELDARWLGMLLRGASRAAKSLPEKAGKKMAKKGGNGQDNVVSGQRLKDTTARWTKWLGKEQDPKCVQGWMNTLSRTGGFNGVLRCDKNTKGGPGKGGSYYPSVPHRGSSLPKWMSKGSFPRVKRELAFEDEVEEREFSDEDLEGRDLVPIGGQGVLEREFISGLDLDERYLLDFELEEMD